jgi:tRNA threonylcarbamoyladenosine biosynthesis protein TsaE
MMTKPFDTLQIKGLEELPKAVSELKKHSEKNKVITFHGSMGAGKTTLIKAFCKALGVTDNVTSPTFSIVNEYETIEGEKIFHFDFYRIKNLHEAFDMGFENYLYSDNLCLIEWPEKISELLPEHYVKVQIEEVAEGNRMITFENI